MLAAVSSRDSVGDQSSSRDTGGDSDEDKETDMTLKKQPCNCGGLRDIWGGKIARISQ